MSLHQSPADKQTQSNPSGLTGPVVFQSLKRAEDSGLLVTGQTSALIADSYNQALWL